MVIQLFSLQMVGLYNDPKGDSIFERSCMAASHPSSGVTKDTTSKIDESEAPGLRKRIKKLEKEVMVSS